MLACTCRSGLYVYGEVYVSCTAGKFFTTWAIREVPNNTIVFHKSQESDWNRCCWYPMHAPSTFTDIHQPRDSRIWLLGLCKSFLYPWWWSSPVAPGAAISEAATLLKFPRGIHSSQLNILFWPPGSLSHPHEAFPGSPSCKLFALAPCLFLREPTSETVVVVMQEGGYCFGEVCAQFLAHQPCCICWPVEVIYNSSIYDYLLSGTHVCFHALFHIYIVFQNWKKDLFIFS